MLRQLFRSIGRRTPAAPSAPAPRRAGDAHPETARELRLDKAHAGVPIDLHRRIQFGGITVAGLDFLTLLESCLRDTHTGIRPAKAFRRYQAALHLARYFAHTIGVPGERAECGVFTGAASLLMCRLMRARHPGFDGSGFHLVDSFEGIGAPGAADALELRTDERGETVGAFAYAKGAMAAPIEYARGAMREFPAARIHKGWIPEVLEALPDAEFAFVHVDVDLYEPTRACLEHFYPRLARGGVMLCDDYGSRTFPGAGRAWDEFCDRHGVTFVALETAQSVILRE